MLNNLLSKNYIPAVLLCIFITASLMFSACSSSKDDRFNDGILIDILNIVGEENLNTLENELNMPIHRGDNPPNIEAIFASLMFNNSEYGTMNDQVGASFVMAPLVMVSSLVPGGDPNTFWDLYFNLSNQDMDNYTILYKNRHVQEPTGVSAASYIIGEDDSFTIAGEHIIEWESNDEIKEIITVQVFSGQVTSEGIVDAYFAFMMIDNAGVPGHIPNGTGRSFKDGTGISEPAQYPGTGDEQGRPAPDNSTSVFGLLK